MSWLTRRVGSVWIAALVHSAFNATAGQPAIFHAAGSAPDSAYVEVTGWTGWLLAALFIAGLLASGRLLRAAEEP